MDLDRGGRDKKNEACTVGKNGMKSGSNCGVHGSKLAQRGDVTEFCGPWMRRYAESHREARTKTKSGAVEKKKVKYITFSCKEDGPECVGALGDTLVGVASAFLVALVTERVLLIDWDSNLNHAFEPAGVDWRMTPGVALGQEGAVGAQGEKARFSWIVEEMSFANKPISGEQDKGLRFVAEQYVHVDHIVMKGNRGIVTKSLLGEDKDLSNKLVKEWGLRPPTAFGCILRLLFR